jgi:hypothetical protein
VDKKKEEAKEKRMDTENKRKAALDQAKDNARYFGDPALPSLLDDPEDESPASPVEESPPSKRKRRKSNNWGSSDEEIQCLECEVLKRRLRKMEEEVKRLKHKEVQGQSRQENRSGMLQLC